MTPQEHQLLDEFLGRLSAAGPVSKDADANALIHARLDGQPDAAYLLVQRCLLVERALGEANRQIETLRQQAGGAGGGGGSFLGGAPEGFGRAPSQSYAPHMDAAPQDRYPASQGSQPYQQPAGAPAQAPGWRDRWFGGGAAAQQAQAQAAPASAGSSFLGRAATTAAGVAGGMFLFNGIEHLIGGAGHNNAGLGGGNSLMGGNDAGSLGGPMTENITENVFVDNGRDGDAQQQGFLDGNDGGDNWADNGYSDDGYSDDGDSLI